MKRLFLADDEAPVIDGLKYLVKKELGRDFEVIGTATSGREAVTKVLQMSPDIVLIDVSMPNLNGMDAIRELRKRGSQASFLLVTAYERFDIAREAVELGVLDYLLKPVSRERLVQALQGASALIDRREDQERIDLAYQESAEALQVLAVSDFLKGIQLGQRWDPDLEPYRTLLKLEPGMARVLVINYASEAVELHRRLAEFLRYKTQVLVGPLIQGRALVLMPLGRESEEDGGRARMEGAIASHLAGLPGSEAVVLRFGPVHPLHDAALSYHEAFLSEAGENSREAKIDEEFLSALGNKNLERARLLLDTLLAEWETKSAPLFEKTGQLAVLLGTGLRLFAQRSVLPPPLRAELVDLDPLWKASDFRGAAEVARARLGLLSHLTQSGPIRSAPVQAALKAIRDEYAKPINLESVADRLALSPHRLSRLFVEETGRGFSDYLIDYRIQKAKELLGTGQVAVKEVSFSVGYQDPNYFSRLFKKATGLTPSEFAEGGAEFPRP